jgi:hypothetical protein
MKSKTPKYIKKAQKYYRKRKTNQGWKYFSILAPVDIIEKLKLFYKQLINKNI